MPRESTPRARLIPVEVTAGEGRLLIATSPSMPKLRVVATSMEELEREIPACIALLYKALHGEDVAVLPVDSDMPIGTGGFQPWAAVPARVDCH